MASGATPAKAEEEKFYSTKATGGIPFIRVQNLKETSELVTDELKYINDFTHTEYLKRSQVSGGDLLTKITGVGRMAVSAVAPTNFSGNINQHIVVSKTENYRTSEILAAYLNSDVGEKLASRRSTGGTRPALDYPALRSIPIVFDPIIVDVLTKAVIQKRQQETQAQILLDSIDEYLLSELGIKLPPDLDNTTENRMFKTSWRQLSGGRYDPTFQKVITEFKGSKYPSRRLRDFAQINPATKFKGLQDADEVTFIPMENVSEDGSIDTSLNRIAADSKGYTTFAENDLLVAKITPCMENGKTGVARNLTNQFGYGSTEFHVFRPKSDNLNIDYLHAFFHANFFRQNAKLTFGGSAGHQRVPPEFFKKMYIPLPPTPVQIKIVQEITTRQQQAQSLRQQAQHDFTAAKREIERLILG
ncbi:restriction endonuclease subunit S [Larkinella punicea]|uniref:Type I restriction modification DNA specificity domain-containing protein n=1 Tax=Larkinella punicea TaxID=2315727 RepID=A0A368JI97_9BACT|nr:restriction endonuclease subunit S [Larkinella punicea]RCR66404.1 hypothetical protein DUE52_27240 [Larkinella punicea]